MERRLAHDLSIRESKHQVGVTRQSRVCIDTSPDRRLEEVALPVDNGVKRLNDVKVDLVVGVSDSGPAPRYWCCERRCGV
jgi:hypothetical protein